MYLDPHNYLRAHRKRWALTQDELAFLLGLSSQAAISRYELRAITPKAEVLIGAEIIFDTRSRDLFPRAVGEVEQAVMQRAELLMRNLEQRTDLPAAAKIALLTALLTRLDNDCPVYDQHTSQQETSGPRPSSDGPGRGMGSL